MIKTYRDVYDELVLSCKLGLKSQDFSKCANIESFIQLKGLTFDSDSIRKDQS